MIEYTLPCTHFHALFTFLYKFFFKKILFFFLILDMWQPLGAIWKVEFVAQFYFK